MERQEGDEARDRERKEGVRGDEHGLDADAPPPCDEHHGETRRYLERAADVVGIDELGGKVAAEEQPRAPENPEREARQQDRTPADGPRTAALARFVQRWFP